MAYAKYRHPVRVKGLGKKRPSREGYVKEAPTKYVPYGHVLSERFTGRDALKEAREFCSKVSRQGASILSLTEDPTSWVFNPEYLVDYRTK